MAYAFDTLLDVYQKKADGNLYLHIQEKGTEDKVLCINPRSLKDKQKEETPARREAKLYLEQLNHATTFLVDSKRVTLLNSQSM